MKNTIIYTFMKPNPINMMRICFKPSGWLLVPVFFVWSATVIAQNWQPVSLGKEFNFRIDSAEYISNTIFADSVEIESGDSVFYLNRIVADCPGCTNQSWKLYNQPQFLKKKMVKKPGGVFLFSDPGKYYLFTLAGLNATWIFDSTANITAQVVSKTSDSLFNSMDSIKTILLSSGQFVKLSKNHGIIQFPLIGTERSYQLEGISGANLGTLIPGFAEFYNFNVGDVFQYSWGQMSFATGDGSGGLKKTTIISKDSSSTGYSYGIINTGMSWYESMIGFHGDTSHYYMNTTTIYIDSINHPCNLFPRKLTRNPLDPGIWGENASFMKIFPDTGQVISRQIGIDYPTTEESPLYLFGGPDTLVSSNLIGFIHKYSVGLGLVIDRIDGFEFNDHTTLIGYVKNGDTTGIVYSDDFILQQVGEKRNAADISLFPNPAHQTVFIRTQPVADEPMKIELYNSLGQVVFSRQVLNPSGLTELNLSFLPEGFYILKFSTSAGITQKELVLQ